MDLKDEHLAQLLLVYSGEGTTLVCTEKNHYKFWNVKMDIDTHTIKTTWGRIGNKVQVSEKKGSFYTMQKMIENKRKKGYEVFSEA